MRYTDFFSRKIAQGPSFFNRQEQRRALTLELSASGSVWLSGERRVGKTSVAVEVCRALSRDASNYGFRRVAWSKCDISSCATMDAARRKILQAVADIAAEIAELDHKASEGIKHFFSRFDPEFTLGGKDLAKLTLKLRTSASMDNPVRDALIALEGLSMEKASQSIIIIDEFQTLSEIKADEGERLEWEIRSALQDASRVAMVFAGSKKRMMSDAFVNKNRALYGQCRRVKVANLPLDDCHKQLLHVSKQCEFSHEEGALALICDISKGHPRDFSHLSLQVFELAVFNTDRPKYISNRVVREAWEYFVKDVVVDEVQSLLKEKLNNNKRAEVATLQAIAHTRVAKIRSSEFAMLVGLTSTPIAGAVRNLEEQGLIRKENGRWMLCEPSYEQALKNISEFHFDPDLVIRVIKNSES
ncbi:AAA family ATPase [Veronia pacifica]|uniref:Orc1-like AAA ATPase domain-containing protein n=1 Tax=Veronia pacifica TaxID=1080227 RepID=A0A1C3EPS2_9GAMM|nr:ATP-binding protein [Veronia pacifica]ODA35260.1 hypothetical protein A8L45_04950 [Veronia pacifica]